MKKAQKWALGLGLATGAAMLLYPPWTGTMQTRNLTGTGWFEPKSLPTQYRFLFDPPREESYSETLVPLFGPTSSPQINASTSIRYRIDEGRLLAQFAVVALVVWAVMYGLKDWQPKSSRPRAGKRTPPAVSPTVSSVPDAYRLNPNMGVTALVLAGMLALSFWGALTAPSMAVSRPVALLLYGAMFGIPLVFVLRALFRGSK